MSAKEDQPDQTAAKTIRVEGTDARVVENALIAAADELDADLNGSRGRPADGEISNAEALVEVARAYTGWSQ
ncbi:MAG: hypothetical protein ACOCUO_00900 [archaeon]